jgi:hypothetical protein
MIERFFVSLFSSRVVALTFRDTTTSRRRRRRSIALAGNEMESSISALIKIIYV